MGSDRARPSARPLGRGSDIPVVRVLLPQHLRTLAGADREVRVEVGDSPTLRTVLDALEASLPTLRGTIRDRQTQQRRAFIRYFACEEDLSHTSLDEPLPKAVALGDEALSIVGAMAGG